MWSARSTARPSAITPSMRPRDLDFCNVKPRSLMRATALRTCVAKSWSPSWRISPRFTSSSRDPSTPVMRSTLCGTSTSGKPSSDSIFAGTSKNLGSKDTAWTS